MGYFGVTYPELLQSYFRVYYMILQYLYTIPRSHCLRAIPMGEFKKKKKTQNKRLHLNSCKKLERQTQDCGNLKHDEQLKLYPWYQGFYSRIYS